MALAPPRKSGSIRAEYAIIDALSVIGLFASLQRHRPSPNRHAHFAAPRDKRVPCPAWL